MTAYDGKVEKDKSHHRRTSSLPTKEVITNFKECIDLNKNMWTNKVIVP